MWLPPSVVDALNIVRLLAMPFLKRIGIAVVAAASVDTGVFLQDDCPGYVVDDYFEHFAWLQAS